MIKRIFHTVTRLWANNDAPRWSFFYIAFIIFIGIFSFLIANNKPIICKYNDKIIFPIFRHHRDLSTISPWKKRQFDWAIWPIIRYLPEDIDLHSMHAPPFPLAKDSSGAPHYLGTDELGRDVAAGIIHGTFISLFIGIGAMLISLIIGLTFGLTSGYWGNHQLYINRFAFVLYLLGIPYLIFWFTSSRWIDEGAAYWRNIGMISLIVVAVGFGMKWLTKNYDKRIRFPIERYVMDFIQLFSSIPGSFILLVLLSGFLPPSLWSVVAIIGGLGWTRIANLARAETLRVRRSNYVNNAKLMGLSDTNILLNYILPAVWPTVLIHSIFMISSAIRLESTISFLGLGLNGTFVTWGSLLASARNNINAWWLMLFPGLILFLTIYCLHLVAQGSKKKH